MKQEVVAMVSHDLRNPLATIRGFLEMLETGIFGTLNETRIQTSSNCKPQYKPHVDPG